MADPLDACSPFTFTDTKQPWVALISREQRHKSIECTFDLKGPILSVTVQVASFPGGFLALNAAVLLATSPAHLLRQAVVGLPFSCKFAFIQGDYVYRVPGPPTLYACQLRYAWAWSGCCLLATALFEVVLCLLACTCMFQVRHAEQAGAQAAIVYDDLYESLIIMSKPQEHPDPGIPSVLMIMPEKVDPLKIKQAGQGEEVAGLREQ
eukprot:360150-Pelagomonas_calceolata.AAC.14